jgi:hypothetical protein
MKYTSTSMGKMHRTGGTHSTDPPIGQSTDLFSGGVNRGGSELNLEEEWESRIRSLEQWICKLLIKNEQLRMSLALAKPPERERRDDLGRRIWERPIHADEP